MKLKYLGTAAAEGIPALFCNCELCLKSRELQGKNLRTRCQALVDDTLLIDFPPDTYLHVREGGLRLDQIHTCILTHNHSDHFYPEDLQMRGNGFTKQVDARPFMIYMTKPALRQAENYYDQWEPDLRDKVIFREIHPFETFSPEMNPEYEITPLRANHDRRCEPVIFLIRKGGKTILWGNDTGELTEDTWDYLETACPKLNLISLDATIFSKETHCGHMGLPNVVSVLKRLKTNGIVNETTTCVINHFSHHYSYLHEDMVRIAAKDGIIAAYDNLVLTV